MEHHAYVVAGDNEAGVEAALAHAKRELGLTAEANPDVIVRTYGLFSVDDARSLIALAQQAPITGDHKVIILSATRVYHEAQNALLKLFEEPPRGTTLYLIVPQIGQLIPTLRSRVAVLGAKRGERETPEIATEFMRGSREKRSAIIKKLASGTDEEERRAARDEALALVNGVEEAAYGAKESPSALVLLKDISILRGHLYDRSAPLKMILEHISLILPKNLGSKLTTGK